MLNILKHNNMEKNKLFLVEGEFDHIKSIADKEPTNQKELSIHSVSYCFSFARYLNENFHYFDNTDAGDVYKDNDGQGLYSEKDIYDEWLNNR